MLVHELAVAKGVFDTSVITSFLFTAPIWPLERGNGSGEHMNTATKRMNERSVTNSQEIGVAASISLPPVFITIAYY